MAEYTLNVGDMAPDAALNLWPAAETTVAAYRGQWLIIYFYPKDNTSGCTTESCEFRDMYADFQELDAAIVGISRDSLKSHQNFSEKFAFPFALASDKDEVVCRAFDVMQVKKMYGKESVGVERSTFIINPEGVVVHAWRKVKVAGHVDEVCQVLRDLQA
ncbi:MAG: peroxiredoxin [Zetaproteobacteria bacterium]|nr:peroxiredoxin [Zetaproteobacteria bacterium]